MRFLRRSLLFFVVVWCFQGSSAIDLFPLAEVEIGLEAEWATVIAGSEIQRFRLEVIGIAENFAGPGRSVILARALDPEHIQSGPVAGMSGSPVWVGERLMGAYAYGYIWPKEQALIGITPIEDMLQMWDLPAGNGWDSGNYSFGDTEQGVHRVPAVQGLSALPLGLAVSGLSPRTLELFREEWESLGLHPQIGVGTFSGDNSGDSDASTELRLEPGSPVAAVLMQGDFSAAATGTVTWRDDDRILGFGHPFLQWGAVEVPMAGAEIFGIARNLQQSFKLSKTGPIVGTLVADRLVGIAGILGPVPSMVDLSIRVERSGLPAEVYEARLFKDEKTLAVLAASCVAEALGQTLQGGVEETVFLDWEIQLPGEAPVTVPEVASGRGIASSMAGRFFRRLDSVVENPYRPVGVEAIRVRARIESGWEYAIPRTIEAQRKSLIGGEELEIQVGWEGRREDRWEESYSVPVPVEAWRSGEIEVHIVDATGFNRLLDLDGRRLEDPIEVLRAWSSSKRSDGFGIVVTVPASEVIVGDAVLRNLPASVERRLLSTGEAASQQGHAVLYSRWIEQGRVVFGELSTRVQVRQPMEFN